MNDPRVLALRCYIFPGHIRDCLPQYRDLYETAYCFWHDTMREEMEQAGLLDHAKNLSSDIYLLHEEVCCLFYEKEVVGVFLFDIKDLKSQSVRDHSYFRNYPKSILDTHIYSCQKIMTIAHLLVHPDWRRSKIGMGVSDLLVGFMSKKLLDSHSDLLIYWTRDNRKTHELGQKYGGQVLLDHFSYAGLPSTIISVKPDQVKIDAHDPIVNTLIDQLWARRKMAKTPQLASVPGRWGRTDGLSTQDSV
jgi:hypothetical protein